MLRGIGTQRIRTPRLLLRQFEYWDLQNVFNGWTKDPEVTRYMRWKYHTSPTETLRFIKEWRRGYSFPLYFHWAIVWQETGKPIGSINLTVVDENDDRGEIGYSLSREYWGRHVMTEALEAVLEYGFNRVGFNRIEAYHSVGNNASGKVMRNAGMVYEGTARQKCRIHTGEYTDCDCYAILKEEYQKQMEERKR